MKPAKKMHKSTGSGRKQNPGLVDAAQWLIFAYSDGHSAQCACERCDGAKKTLRQARVLRAAA